MQRLSQRGPKGQSAGGLHRDRRTTRDDDILAELSGSEDERNDEDDEEEDEEDDVVIEDYDHEERTSSSSKSSSPLALVDRAMQQLALGKNLLVGGGADDASASSSSSSSTMNKKQTKMVPMKRTTRGFDNVLWREERGTARHSTSSASSGGSARRGYEEGEEGSFTKLIAFSEAVKKIALLLKKGNAGNAEELQTERLVARRLCREIELELKQMKPCSISRPKTHRSTKKGGRVMNEEECEYSEDDEYEDGEKLRQQKTYNQLKSDFETMKRKFDEIDQALREQDKAQRRGNRKPSASIFGDLNVMDDYDAPSHDKRQSRNQGSKRAPPKATSTKTSSRSQLDSEEDEEEEKPIGKQQQQMKYYKSQGPAQSDVDESLASLEGELEQLLNLFRDFNELVHAQQPMIDKFEEQVLEAEGQTKSAVTELATGASYGAYSLPLVGAAVGGLLFGPLGAIAGAKGAAAVGVCVMGGMGLGAYVGRQISAKQKQDAALILERYRQQGQERFSQRRPGKAPDDTEYSDEYDDYSDEED